MTTSSVGTRLPGIVPEVHNLDPRYRYDLSALADELTTQRDATRRLFTSLIEPALLRTCSVGEAEVSARAWGFIAAGHSCPTWACSWSGMVGRVAGG